MYAATTGTFLQRDPRGQPGQPVVEYSHEAVTRLIKNRSRSGGVDDNLYGYVNSRPLNGVDPFGLEGFMSGGGISGLGPVGSWQRPPQSSNTIIFTMDSNDSDCNRWDIECRRLQAAMPGSAYYRRAQKQSSILARIRHNKSCNVVFVGHQGGPSTHGGIVTYLDDKTESVILPDPAFEAQLKAAFKANGCNSCTITINACGGNDPLAPGTRNGIANGTGCTVNGAVPPTNDTFITIGKCPGQKWYSLDPKSKPKDNPENDGGACAGPVPHVSYPPNQ
jgi:hypothetical protein